MSSVIHSAAGSLVVVEDESNMIVEVLMAKRKTTTSFFPGYYVLPGGVIDPNDVELARSVNVLQAPQDGGFSEATYRIAFIREFFEEIGILITKDGLLAGTGMRRLQEELTRDRITFSDLLNELGLSVADLPLPQLWHAGSRLRPPFVKKRYLARYYLLKITPMDKVEPMVNTSEIETAGWYRPTELLKKYEQLEIGLPPPTLQQVRYFARFPFELAIKKLKQLRKEKHGVDFPVELRPDVEAIPIPSRTLPPHQTTNMVILGGKECYLVDPSPSSVESRQHVLEVLDRLKSEGKIVKGIFLTHHHPDHVEGAFLLQDLLNVPVIAHESTAKHLLGRVDVVLKEETWFSARDYHGNEVELKVIFTPGHTEGSITILIPSRRVAVVGDLMAGVGTVIINPPEGNLRDYLSSLRRLQQFELDMIIPGHGPFILNPFERIDEYIKHRMERHENVRKAVKNGVNTLHDIVKTVYTDVPEQYHSMAARSVLAHLLMMLEDGDIDQETLDSMVK